MSKVSKEQIQEWVENQVTEALKDFLEKELDAIQQTPITNCLVYGEPHKTQENMVELEAREAATSNLVSYLSGDWTYFTEEEDSDETGYEQIGYHSER